MKKYRLKAKELILAIVIMLLLSSNLSAQEWNNRQGGLFGDPVSSASNGLMNRGRTLFEGNINGQGFGTTGAEITGQTFGTPLNGGLFVLLIASAGYGALKTRKTKNRKEKQV